MIYIGSPTAFYAITSLFTVALLQCYMFSIGSILWRRIRMPETIPEARQFSLGKWGIPVNAVAFVWCMWAFVSESVPEDLKKDFLTSVIATVLVFLANVQEPRCGGLQLGRGYLRRRGDCCGGVVFHRRAQALSWSGHAGEEDLDEDASR